jgi:hypothetical protein
MLTRRDHSSVVPSVAYQIKLNAEFILYLEQMTGGLGNNLKKG